MKKYTFGVDVGGTTAKIGLFEPGGDLIDSWEIPTRTEDDGSHILPDIAEAIKCKMEEQALTPADVAGIGLGVPGPVGTDGTVYKCVNLGWGEFNVCDALSALTGLPVKAGNDANVAALGEMLAGGGAGHRDIIMVTLGTGVGGGIIIDGKIAAGINGASGEIGHIPIAEPEDEPDVCGCGKRGCLEQYVSANGFVRVTRKYLAEHPDEETILNEAETLSCKKIFDAAKEGDEVALHMVDTMCRTLGRALAAVACVINTEVFVIGGGVSKAGTILTDGIEKYYRQYAFQASRDTRFALAQLGNNAGIYGGAGLVNDI